MGLWTRLRNWWESLGSENPRGDYIICCPCPNCYQPEATLWEEGKAGVETTFLLCDNCGYRTDDADILWALIDRAAVVVHDSKQVEPKTSNERR